MTWHIDFISHLSIQPYTTFALISITNTAERSVIKFVQLRIFYVKSFFKIPDAISFITLFTKRYFFSTTLSIMIECRTNIEFPIRRKGDICNSSAAIIHFVKHHTVSKEIELRKTSTCIKTCKFQRPFFQTFFIDINPSLISC